MVVAGKPRQGGKPVLDLIQGHRSVVPGIDANIKALTVSWHVAMRVPEKGEGTVVAGVPSPHCIVKQDDALAIKLDFAIMRRWLGPQQAQRGAGAHVMIPKDQSLSAAQGPKNSLRLLAATAVKGKIAQVPDIIPRPDNSVPPLDQGFIMLLDRGKRPVAILENRRMSEVRVRGKKDCHVLRRHRSAQALALQGSRSSCAAASFCCFTKFFRCKSK